MKKRRLPEQNEALAELLQETRKPAVTAPKPNLTSMFTLKTKSEKKAPLKRMKDSYDMGAHLDRELEALQRKAEIEELKADAKDWFVDTFTP